MIPERLMGVGRALFFGAIGAIPGMILSVVGWAISGSPEDWRGGLWIACYLPFFGCIAAGLVLGWRSEGPGLEV